MDVLARCSVYVMKRQGHCPRTTSQSHGVCNHRQNDARSMLVASRRDQKKSFLQGTFNGTEDAFCEAVAIKLPVERY